MHAGCDNRLFNALFEAQPECMLRAGRHPRQSVAPACLCCLLGESVPSWLSCLQLLFLSLSLAKCRSLVVPCRPLLRPADADVRAVCERRALRFGRRLLVEGATSFASADTLVEQADLARHDQQQPRFPL